MAATDESINSAPKLGLADTTALVATQAIGVGIFLTPALMARSLQSPLGVLGIWVLMGALALSGAWCVGKLAARFPHSGGAYVYLREIYGRDFAFLFGWMSFWVMDTGVMAALAAGAVGYIAYLHPLTTGHQRLLAALLPAGLGMAFLLIPGAALRALNGLNLLKLAAISGLPLWIFVSGRGHWANLKPWWKAPPVPWLPHAGSALVAAFFALAGWWETAKIADQVRNPARTLPRALAWGVSLVIALYVLLTAALLILLPIARLAPGEALLAQAGGALAGPWAARFLCGVVVICVAGMLGSLLLTTPQVYLAMARNHLFPAALAKVNGKGWPSRITGLQLCMIALLTLTGGFAAIAAFPVFTAILFLAITVAGVWRLPHLGWAGRWVPALFLLLALLVLVPVLAHFRHALGGVAITLLGWPVYRWLARRNSQNLQPEALSI